MTSSASSSAVASARRWWQRGNANHGWLRTSHTFSFASYYDPSYMSFGPLRVINEDRVAPKTGFPTHPHANAEIFSYILSGELTHKDSLGNIETLRRGEVQFTSAGKGVRHSEYNDHAKEEVHFLQIWYIPNKRNLPPKYFTLPQVPDAEKTDKFMTLIRDIDTFAPSEVKSGLLPKGQAIPAQANLTTRASILTPGHSVEHVLGAETRQKDGERWVYLHVAMTGGYKDPSKWEEQLRKDIAGYSSHAQRLSHAARFVKETYGVSPPWVAAAGGSQAKLQALGADKPRVTLTYAQSRDGKIAGANKKVLALSGEESMIMTHTLRTMHDAILVGAGTLKNDNPQLNARLLNPLPDGSQVPLALCPQPVVLDAKLETPLDCKLLANAKAGTGKAPIVVTAANGDASKLAALREAGAVVQEVAADAQGQLAWADVFAALQSQHGLQSIMVEGGASVIKGLYKAHARAPLLDHVIVTVARVAVGDEGLGYEAPRWITQALQPTAKAVAAGAPASQSSNAGEMQPVHLDPVVFNKDVVVAWAAAPHALPAEATAGARIRVNGSTYLGEGDGVFLRKGEVGDVVSVENVGAVNAEFILFDVEPGTENDDDSE